MNSLPKTYLNNKFILFICCKFNLYKCFYKKKREKIKMNSYFREYINFCALRNNRDLDQGCSFSSFADHGFKNHCFATKQRDGRTAKGVAK